MGLFIVIFTYCLILFFYIIASRKMCRRKIISYLTLGFFCWCAISLCSYVNFFFIGFHSSATNIFLLFYLVALLIRHMYERIIIFDVSLGDSFLFLDTRTINIRPLWRSSFLSHQLAFKIAYIITIIQCLVIISIMISMESEDLYSIIMINWRRNKTILLDFFISLFSMSSNIINSTDTESISLKHLTWNFRTITVLIVCSLITILTILG
jgi:hypothetical protein